MGAFSPRRFLAAVAAFGVVLAAGTVGFHLLEGEGWVASLYRAVVTTTLTGLDNRPHSIGGQAFSLVVLFAGVAIFLSVAGAIVEMITRGVLTGAVAERRRRRAIESLQDHYVICGFGRVGRRVGDEFRAAGIAYVVVDFNADAVAAARERGEHLVEGTGTNDDDLTAAGVDRARGLVASSDSDVDNLYMALSARARRPELLIVARASTPDAARKLELAGADRVVQPYATAGMEMAKLALKPQVAAFLDIVSTHSGVDFRFEEIEVTFASGRVGESIRELRVRTQTGALIISLRRADGTFEITPPPDTVLHEGDVLIAVGTEPELQRLEELFAAEGSGAR